MRFYKYQYYFLHDEDHITRISICIKHASVIAVHYGITFTLTEQLAMRDLNACNFNADIFCTTRLFCWTFFPDTFIWDDLLE